MSQVGLECVLIATPETNICPGVRRHSLGPSNLLDLHMYLYQCYTSTEALARLSHIFMNPSKRVMQTGNSALPWPATEPHCDDIPDGFGAAHCRAF